MSEQHGYVEAVCPNCRVGMMLDATKVAQMDVSGVWCQACDFIATLTNVLTARDYLRDLRSGKFEALS